MTSRLYVGRLPEDVRERDLERFFKGFGKITEILLRNGYGFVQFEDFRDAEDAIHELNGTKLLGKRILVEPTRRPPKTAPGAPRYRSPALQRKSGYRLIVKNLSSRIDWRQLKERMQRAGKVTFADAHRDRRNEGVVEFESRYDMKQAIKMFDDTELNGRYIRLVEDNRRRSRSRSSSVSSRSRSGSRSHGYQSKSRSVRSYRRSRSESRRRSRSMSAPSRSWSGRSSGRSSHRSRRS